MIGQPVHWFAWLIHRYHLEESLGQIIWLFSIAVFAYWAVIHYQALTGVFWIGMMIHTAVFAQWGQVAREWLALCWWRLENEQID